MTNLQLISFLENYPYVWVSTRVDGKIYSLLNVEFLIQDTKDKDPNAKSIISNEEYTLIPKLFDDDDIICDLTT